MDNHFELELESLRQKLLLMASHTETAVNDSVQAIVKRDADLAVKVRADDDIIDQFEIEIDEMAVLLLTKAPLATDLRLVTVVMRVSQNLERIGDEATKIAKRATDILRDPPMRIKIDLPRMASLTIAMVKDALDALVQKDPRAARLIIPRDKEVDDFNNQLNEELMRHMAATPQAIPLCLHWMVVIKSLERIADHAKNIAEETIFLCEAENVRRKLEVV